MDNKEKRKIASDRLDALFKQTIGDPKRWGIKAVHRTALTFKYTDLVTGEPRVAKITPQDVVDYDWNYHNDFQSSVRKLGRKMTGDWRPMNELTYMCFTWFKTVCREELVAAAKQHPGMTLI